jgi:hypothetical protein
VDLAHVLADPVFAMTAGLVLAARRLPTLVPASAVVATDLAATAPAHAQMATLALSAKLRLISAQVSTADRAHAAAAAASVQEATQAPAVKLVSGIVCLVTLCYHSKSSLAA